MEEWIREGKVTVNGELAVIGTRVKPSERSASAEAVRWPATHRLPRVLVYHKPEGEIVSHDDPEGRASVFEQLPDLRGAKWLAVGPTGLQHVGASHLHDIRASSRTA